LTSSSSGCAIILAGPSLLDVVAHFPTREERYSNMSESFYIHPTDMAIKSLFRYYFGPLSEAGNDFQHAYTEFESGFSIPFANFIRGAFRK
jgi:hypothetical protein